jgi:hypothetical protein
VAGAQQDERVRRIGVLMNLFSEDREGQARVAAFRDGLQRSGWIEGRNARLDIRWDRYEEIQDEKGDGDPVRRNHARTP